jgi:hypothetical protein
VGYENILSAIVVHVCEIDTHARLRRAVDAYGAAANARFVAKRAVLLVDPKLVRVAIVGHVDVRPSDRR